MSRILAVLSVSSLLLGSACNRNDPTIPTTTERPPRLSYAWVRIEGSITIKEDPYSGAIQVTCPTATIAGQAHQGRYALFKKIEAPAGDAFAVCRFDIGQPIQATHAFELPLVGRVDSVQTHNVDVIVPPDPPPVAHMELPIRSVSAAGNHTCAVSATGTTYCWGSNSGAELGFGSHLPTSYPARVVWDQTAVTVSTFGYTKDWNSVGAPASCALQQDGAVYCWGERMLGAFDTGLTRKDAQLPQRVRNVPAFTKLEGGAVQACGITASEELYCWGGGSYASLELGRVNLSGVVDVAGSLSHSCALTRDGKWHCWGSNAWGEFGDTTVAHSFKRIAVGRNFTCALDQDGFAYCWGRNNSGQLGRGSMTAECYWGSQTAMCPGTDVSPQRVIKDVRFTEIDAGTNHICALATNGLLYCWGEGYSGKLGNYADNTRSDPVIVALSDPLRFRQFSVGEHHACGVVTDGKVYCWGTGADGRLGTNATGDKNLPAAVWGQ